MSIELHPFEPPQQEDLVGDYRALSSAAVASVLLGLLSGFAFMGYLLAIVPLAGTISGVYALLQIRRRPEDLTGRGLAWVGVGFSLFCLIGGPLTVLLNNIYEVPPGYFPIDYAQLQPEPGQSIPAFARQLEGRKIFIKGFVFPGATSNGIKQFTLVRDQGTCCFGKNPRITDRIEVTLVDPLRLTFNTRVNRVAGVFHVVDPGNTKRPPGTAYYYLTADYLE